MPRSPSNLAAGNFMLDLSLHAGPTTTSGPFSYLLNVTLDSTTPIARSRRPAIMPYSGVITSLSHKLLRLPVHLLSLHDLDSTELRVPLFERLAFQRGRANIPTTAYLEIQSQKLPPHCPPPSHSAIDVHILSPPTTTPGIALQIYSAELHFHARFQGLRYFVYNFRIPSFLIFTSLFYIFAVTSTAVAWAFVSAVLSVRDPHAHLSGVRPKTEKSSSSSSTGQRPAIKSEEGQDQGLNIRDIKAEDDEDNSDPDIPLDSQSLAHLSGTERTFPTLGPRSPPLRYTPTSTDDTDPSLWPVPREDNHHDAEDEDEEDEEGFDAAGYPRGRPPMDLEAKHEDDDDDDDGYRGGDRDSGIGTSMDSEAVNPAASGSVRRRAASRGASQGGGGGGGGGGRVR